MSVFSSPAERILPFHAPAHALATAGFVLAICLGTTWVVWNWTSEQAEHDSADVFQAETIKIQDALRLRLARLDSLLHGAQGFATTSEALTTSHWSTYTRNLGVGTFYPAVRSLGYIEHVPAGARAAHERRMRSEGMTDYAIRPEGERSEYAPIVFVERFQADTVPPPYGYDMLTLPERRDALTRAAETGETSITERTAGLARPGGIAREFLMYRPVYRSGAQLHGPPERRAALQGYVYAFFQFAPMLDEPLKPMRAAIRVEVFDGDGTSEAARVYDSHAQESAPPASGRIGVSRFEYGSKAWTLRVSAQPHSETRIVRDVSRLVVVSGIAISLLLTFIVWALATTQVRAVALAERMTAALRDSEATQRAILETAVDAIILIDERGIVQSFNQAAERIFGHHAPDVVGRNVNMLMPSPDREQHDRYLAAYLATGHAKIIGIGREVQGQRRDGEVFSMTLAVSEVRTERGRMFSGIMRDISERRRRDAQIVNLNRDLLRRAEELAAANRELESFSYSISHDLRAPLRHIAGYVRLIKEQAPALDEKTRERLDNVVSATTRMAALIDDLLEFSRMGRADLARTTVDLEHIANKVLLDLQPECANRHVTWRIGAMPEAYGDAALIEAVLGNLFSNALKFTRQRPQTVIEFGAMPDAAGEVVYFVRDNGAGFDMRYASKLFQVFQRLHGEEEFEGTGIGLAIVERIVKRHGGRVWAEGEPDHGATFYFSLPKPPQGTEAPQHERDPKHPAG